MAERLTSGTDDRTLSDPQNFEHGVVSSDAVYVPHSKQSFRGRRGRGQLPGNYRHGQQQNDSLDRSESDGLKQYSGGRGQKPSRRHNQNYGRRNIRSAADERQQLPEFGVDSGCLESRVVDHNASFGASATTYNGVDHSRFDETEVGVPSYHVQEHAGNSRAARKTYEDHRYEGRNQRRGVEQQPRRRGRRAYSGGRGHRGAYNYFSDEKVVAVSAPDVDGSNEPAAGFDISNRTDFPVNIEFTNSDHRSYGPKAQFSRKSKSSNEKPAVKDDKYDVQRPSTTSRDNNCIADDVQFHNLRISNMSNEPKEVNTQQLSNQAAFNVRIKKNDPEFETQRGNSSHIIISHLFIIYTLKNFIQYNTIRCCQWQKYSGPKYSIQNTCILMHTVTSR